jgi:hypothetical protein
MVSFWHLLCSTLDKGISMKLITIVLLLFANSVLAESGFYSPRDNKFSGPVKEASKSVFEIRTAFISDLENFSDVMVADISNPSNKNTVLAKIDQAQDPRDRIILRAFVANCEKQATLAECPLPSSFNGGTGFITDGGSKFWTNAHVVDPMVKTRAASREKTVSEILHTKDNYPVFIFDADGNLVFNGLEEQLSFGNLPGQSKVLTQKDDWFGIDNDAISLSLPNALGKPLKFSSQSFSENQNVSIIGYPYCTGCADPSGNNDLTFSNRGSTPNAENCIEKSTKGYIMNADQWAEFADIPQALMGDVDKSHFMITTADTQHGMSGGPMLNDQGEVLGLNAGSKPVRWNNKVLVYSRGVRPQGL